MAVNITCLNNCLWANSKPKSSEYAVPVFPAMVHLLSRFYNRAYQGVQLSGGFQARPGNLMGRGSGRRVGGGSEHQERPHVRDWCGRVDAWKNYSGAAGGCDSDPHPVNALRSSVPHPRFNMVPLPGVYDHLDGPQLGGFRGLALLLS